MIKKNTKKRMILVVARLLYWTGLITIVKMLMGVHEKPIILCFHRIVNKKAENAQNYSFVSVDAFGLLLKYISSRYKIVGVDEAICNANGSLCRNCCLLTFDDGWVDFYENAFPILIRYNAPALLFLVSGFIGTTQNMWQQELNFYYRCIYTDAEKYQQLSDLLIGLDIDIHSCDEGTIIPKKEIREVIEKLKRLNNQEIEMVLEHVKMIADEDYKATNNRYFLNWDEVKELAQHNITIGAHTHRHVILTKETDEIGREEVLLSKKSIEKNLKSEVKYFAYPNGNFDDRSKTIVSEAGFEAAFALEDISKPSDKYSIPRIYIDGESITDLNGVFSVPLLEYKITRHLIAESKNRHV